MTNISLMVVGLVIMLIGLYRTIPLSLNRKFWLALIPIFAMCIVFIGIACWKKGALGFEDGLKFTVASTGGFLPIIAGYFLTMGFSQVVFGIYREQIIGSLSGNHGFLTAWVSSFVMPSPTLIAPQMAQTWNATHAARPALILAFICMSFNSPALFYLRTMGMSWDHQWKMYGAGIIACLILTPLLKGAQLLRFL